MFRRPYLITSLLSAVVYLGGTNASQSSLLAQEENKPESPKIVTVDGVRLNALFYRSPKKSIGTVIMLHPIGIGESTKKEGWKDLAETLQKNNYSVLMFDFRGHGESTTIEQPESFWSILPNRQYVRRTSKDGDSIDIKDYNLQSYNYYPILVNDIAAVKAYLDRRHDMGDCNTSNTIVIGAESGATLGAIWMNSEWHRIRMIPPEMPFMKPTFEKRAEGNDIVAAIFLNIHQTLGKRPVPLNFTLLKACKLQATPTAFFYGEKDPKASQYTKLVSTVKDKGKKWDYILPVKVPDTNLSGIKLLVKSLKTKDGIVDYLEAVKERSNEWEGRNFAQGSYVWIRNGVPVPCKTKEEKSFKFDTYEKFINP